MICWRKKKKYYNRPIPLPSCAGGKYKIVIDFKGDVYPCRYFQTKKFFCGNIFKEKLERIWRNGKGFKFFRNIILYDILPPECRVCYKRSVCFGGCLIWRIYNKKQGCYEKDIRCKLGAAYIGS
jgi:radical SAM protein with 4Fe4S-binding SPASM domain